MRAMRARSRSTDGMEILEGRMRIKRCWNRFSPGTVCTGGMCGKAGAVVLLWVLTGLAGGGWTDALAETERSGEGSQEAASEAPALQRWQDDGVQEEYRDGYTRLVVQDLIERGGYRFSVLEDPPRLVVDIQEPKRTLSWDRLALKGDAFTQLRVGRYPEKIRLVFDFRKNGIPDPQVRAEKGSLIVVCERAGENGHRAVSVGGPDVPVVSGRPVPVSAIDFKYNDETSDIIVKMEAGAAYDIVEQEKRIVLKVPGAVLPDHLQRVIDTQGFASSVLSIQPRQETTSRGAQASITVLLREKSVYDVLKEGNSIRIRVRNPATKPVIAALPKPNVGKAETVRLTAGVPEVPAGEKAVQAEPKSRVPAPVAAQRAEPSRFRLPEKSYTGRKISLDFKDADIQNVLRLIAEVSGKNVVISEAVQGKVTIRLMNVPWDMALDVILKTYALDKEELGPNILRVAPYTQLKKERDDAVNAAKALVQVEELVTQVVTLNYAKAQNIQSMLDKMKSARPEASILVDSRTNSLVLKDLPRTIEEMVRLIRELDQQTPQVLIEAKIVELDVEFERALGIQWGTSYNAGPATGNPTGMNFPGTAAVGGAAQNVSGITPAGVPNPVVNLPAAIDSTAGGALGFSLASITNSFRLDMQLSALEKKKHARVLSSPRVATLNNQEARIEQGQEVPYQTTSDEGTKTEFKDAMLRLYVTPQINSDRSIIMKIVVSNDTPLKEVSVGYIIGKKEASTSVLVNDAETAVIGGIYTDDVQKTEGGVPWFMDIPGLGYLFKTEGNSKKRSELVIFITPRIIPARTVPVEQWIQQ
jgi:type IV pilus assembly protein PilQ